METGRQFLPPDAIRGASDTEEELIPREPCAAGVHWERVTPLKSRPETKDAVEMHIGCGRCPFHPDMPILGEAGNPEDALTAAKEKAVDILRLNCPILKTMPESQFKDFLPEDLR